ncbi:unnamed protein product [Blepharisma stoltei]|uniref:Uncharacterized protein n=1 Tax=Blepharisma stoltei TaxID=1481888 RepID=A0AAU9J3B7_9CILI|nr:unnamed protein product [Blepharisma stoltei]
MVHYFYQLKHCFWVFSIFISNLSYLGIIDKVSHNLFTQQSIFWFVKWKKKKLSQGNCYSFKAYCNLVKNWFKIILFIMMWEAAENFWISHHDIFKRIEL